MGGEKVRRNQNSQDDNVIVAIGSILTNIVSRDIASDRFQFGIAFTLYSCDGIGSTVTLFCISTIILSLLDLAFSLRRSPP